MLIIFQIVICSGEDAAKMHKEMERVMIPTVEAVRAVGAAYASAATAITTAANSGSGETGGGVAYVKTLESMRAELLSVLHDAATIAAQNAKQASRLALLQCVEFR